MKTVALTAGERVPAYGQGTWFIGDDRARRAEEITTLQLGIDLGAALIDTAEMYGDGRSEELVGEAIAGRRDKVFLVSKVLPHHATRRGTVTACEQSLKRLRTDRLDLYLLHWRGGVPFAETIEGLTALQRAGKIRHFGVSNLDLDDMREFVDTKSGSAVAANQLLYNLTRRGIEWDLLPWLNERRIPVMAYSPLEQARLLSNRKFSAYAAECGMTPAQLALAWLLSHDNVMVIPKTGRPERLRENLGALERALTADELRGLDRLFPPPAGPRPLEML